MMLQWQSIMAALTTFEPVFILLNKEFTMPNIRIYTTPWCGDCRAAKRFLAEKAMDYEEINIEEACGAADALMRATGGEKSVPTFDIDGFWVTCSPFDRKKFLEALRLLKVER